MTPDLQSINLTVTLELGSSFYMFFKSDKQQLTRIETALGLIQTDLKELMLSQQELNDLLSKIDTTTNTIASNVTAIATVSQTISDEIDAFLKANPPGTTLTDAQVAQLQSFGDRAKAAADASTAQVTVLQAIAAKGAPVVPPPPPPPPSLPPTT